MLVSAPPPWSVPPRLAAWPRQRAATVRTVRRLLGALPPRPRSPRAAILGVREERHYRREDLCLDDGAGTAIPATFLRPRSGAPPYPAVLFHHSHWGDYAVGLEEVFQPWPVRETPAVSLTRRGYAVLAIDAYAFGGRRGRGPGGPRETGRAEELSLAKLFLWHGTSLWARMLRDDQIALDYLSSRPEVDRRRIGATGMSMGSTRSWWLAALDARIAAVVAVACLTRYQDLVRARALHRHGIYYFLPGMLRHFDVEAVISLIAPRPFLALTGARDAGSPASGVRAIARACAPLWALHGARTAFAAPILARHGHVYTRPMWNRMLDWFDVHL